MCLCGQKGNSPPSSEVKQDLKDVSQTIPWLSGTRNALTQEGKLNLKSPTWSHKVGLHTRCGFPHHVP